MMSDGVSTDAEAPWLIELLHRPNSRSLKDYASYILTEAERINGEDDDRTVLVLRVGKK
jgi:hypothetical protein